MTGRRTSMGGDARAIAGTDGPRTLVLRFAIPCLIAFALVGLLAERILDESTRRQLLAAQQPAAEAVAELLYFNLLEVAELDEPVTERRWVSFAQLIPYEIGAERYSHATLFTVEGEVVWSSSPGLVGATFEGVRPALERVVRSREAVSRFAEPGDDSLAVALTRSAIVVDTPVGGVTTGRGLVMRLIADSAPINEVLEDQARTLVWVLSSCLLGLFVVILPVAAAAGRTMQTRALDVVRAERRFRRLAEQSPTGVLILRHDRGWRCEYANDAVGRITGRSSGEWTANDANFAKLWPAGASRDEIWEGLRAAANGSTPVVLEVAWPCPENDERWLGVHIATVADIEAGTPAVLQLVIVDITADKVHRTSMSQALAREQEAASRLRQLDDMKSALLRAVSHEVRTPLTVILGNSAILRVRGPELPAPTAAALCEAMERNARRLERLLADLMDLDRLSRGAMNVRYEPTELSALVSRVVGGMGITTHPVEVQTERATVDAHAGSVERILEHLLANAVKHTPDGTDIRVLLERAEGGGVAITVEDAGPGVAPGVADRVLEPFVQGPASADHANPGTGLGLSLVHRLVMMHSGWIEIDGSESGGARFTVRLPARPDDTDGAGDPADERFIVTLPPTSQSSARPRGR